MEKSSKVFVGMDVHKESIDITLAEQGGEVRRLGQIGGDRGSLLNHAATQRANISLIDRRQRWRRRVPARASLHPGAQKDAGPRSPLLTRRSHINVHAHRRAPTDLSTTRRLRARPGGARG